MIEAREKVDMVTDSIEALVMLQDLRTRLKLLQDYIDEIELKEAKEAVDNPRSYNTDLKYVNIKVDKVVWFLGLKHNDEAVGMFKEALEEYNRQMASEKEGKDGKAV